MSSSNVGLMIKAVKIKLNVTITIAGGVVGVPTAWRRSAKTITIRVKEVIATITVGKIVRTVRIRRSLNEVARL